MRNLLFSRKIKVFDAIIKPLRCSMPAWG